MDQGIHGLAALVITKQASRLLLLSHSFTTLSSGFTGVELLQRQALVFMDARASDNRGFITFAVSIGLVQVVQSVSRKCLSCRRASRHGVSSSSCLDAEACRCRWRQHSSLSARPAPIQQLTSHSSPAIEILPLNYSSMVVAITVTWRKSLSWTRKSCKFRSTGCPVALILFAYNTGH